MPDIYFTSDTHYYHANIIRYAGRPFASVDEMNEAMIERWNSVVRPGDLVYHLGDFALGRSEHAVALARRLTGNKYLIFGNHDKVLRKSVEFLAQWVWARDMTQIEVAGQKITLCHYAMRTWNCAHHGAWQLFGHSHGSIASIGRQADVGVDCWDYTPVSFETVRDLMSTRDFASVDHHEEDRHGD